MAHDIGDLVRIYAVFRDAAGVQTATTVTLTVRKPDGTVSTPSVSAAGAGEEAQAEAALGEALSGVTGVYRADISLDQSGRWWYRWAGSGAVTEVEEGALFVALRRVP